MTRDIQEIQRELEVFIRIATKLRQQKVCDLAAIAAVERNIDACRQELYTPKPSHRL